jgi:hypothetical protein
MASLPKPLIALLVATVAVFALWTAVLKKTVTGTGSGSSQSTPALQSAIAKAHQAVTTANQSSVAHGGTVSQTSTPAAPATHPAAPAAHPASRPAPAPAKAAHKPSHSHAANVPSVKSVVNAIDAHKVVVLLFFNPSAADDQAVKRELGGVSAHGGQVAKFAVPVSQLAQFQAVTTRVAVTSSPTLLVIDKQGQASSLVGYVDQLDISQRVADALSAK